MMNNKTFIADLHIHSKYSRATAKDLDLEHLYVWAQKKGITVVGTGDFTHPQWYTELAEKLEPAEPGLYRLKPEIEQCWNEWVPLSCRAPVRFILSCEISNIYKKKDRTRKNHNLVFFPDLDCVNRFNTRLDAIGNIHSDGRPILGLDARDLLEIMLETSTDGFLIPAHIWTPWFSMLGSKSGFDALTECFDDLSAYIFAAETGLSSDPAMNWRVSALDNITLVSNSDAHSPSKLGREANWFNTRMNYYAIRKAIESADKNEFLGTFEFYPEEGKYHVDGHRKCDICFTPSQTRNHSGRCPVCGKPLTLGVLHRVEELATRQEGIQPERALPFFRLIPLEDLLSEILNVGAKSKKVQRTYQSLIEQLGSEFRILHTLNPEAIDRAGVPLLAEAICRMRDNRVSFSPGYDGCYGTVQIFDQHEKSQLLGQKKLFTAFDKKVSQKKRPALLHHQAPSNPEPSADFIPNTSKPSPKPVIALNEDQQQAVDHSQGHLMIVAGPGTGKTRTLTHKIAQIIKNGADTHRMLAVTFTNKAAMEMKTRLESLLDADCRLPFVGTFHALGYQILKSSMPDGSLGVVDEDMRRALMKDVLSINRMDTSARVDELMQWVVSAKQNLISFSQSLDGICPPDQMGGFVSFYQEYEKMLSMLGVVDFEDLIFKSVALLSKAENHCPFCSEGFDHIFIDEYQDINAGQYQLVKLLAGKLTNVSIIGDPDQSIYGFRGSDTNCFKWFLHDFPDAKTVFLRKNYRSIQTILDVSSQVIRSNPESLETGHRRAVFSDLSGDKTIHLMQLKTERSEAVAIGKTIEQMIGGTGFFSIDSGAVDGNVQPLSFADFAVLVRTRGQIQAIGETLEKAGIPCQVVDRKTILDHDDIKKLIAVFKIIHETGGFDDLEIAVQMLNPSVSQKTIERLKIWAYKKELPLADALIQVRRLPIPHISIAQQQHLFDVIIALTKIKKSIDGLFVPQIVETLMDKTGINQTVVDDRIFENSYQQLLQISQDYPTDPNGFLASIALCKDTDVYHHQVEKVSLMTMHASKGLEFPVVFIAGCEDGYIPYHAPGRDADIYEERRLFYVALTRAMQHLFLTTADTRLIHGQQYHRQLSPFVKDIENRYKQFSQPEISRKAKPAQEQLSLF